MALLGAVSVIVTGCSQTRGITIAEATTSAATVSPVVHPTGLDPLTTTRTFAGPGLDADVTAFKVIQNVAPNADMPAGGGHWAGADVQTCLKKAAGDFTVSGRDWSVADAQGHEYGASAETDDSFPTALYPTSPESLAVGTCNRGWLVFPVPYGVDVITVEYKPAYQAPAIWSVP